MIQRVLLGFLTGIVLLGAILFIFRRQEDKKRKRLDK